MATIREYETAKGKRFEVGYTKPDGGRTRKRGFRTKRDAKVWSAANLIAMSKPNYRTQSNLSQKLGPFIDEFLARRATLAARRSPLPRSRTVRPLRASGSRRTGARRPWRRSRRSR